VTAVKQANDDLDQARRIVELGLDLYAGDDPLLLPFLGLGGTGGICVRSHIAGPEMKEMVRRYRAGDADGARKIDEALAPLWELDAVAVNPIPIKTALALVGLDVGGFRLPMVSATDEELERVRDCLARAGLSIPAAA
jgi:4-hydroxy-tetrahydrodipicolinate synthase